VLVQDYANSVSLRVGVERRLGDRYAARAGYSFEDSPAPAASLSPLLFDADTHRFSVGGSWIHGTWRLDGAAAYAIAPARFTGASRDGYDGSYEIEGFTAGLSLGYAF
jgi:long-subunit fatty acid transport protein